MANAEIDIDRIISILDQNYRQWNAPIVSYVAQRGAAPFEILVSTLLSLRTKDEVTALATARLSEKAATPQQMLQLTEKQIQKLIYPVGFYKTKAKRLLEICRRLLDDFGGAVPDELETLLTLPGVGRKTANLVLTEGFRKDAVCVDTHVHRISNRLGYVTTTTAEKTEWALRKILPRRHWIKYNKLMVAFGQTICRPVSPWCSKCPISTLCARTGVEKRR